MAILSLGVSYRAAPVELLERLAFTEDDLPKAYHHLTRQVAVRGAVIISTCNRVEVFADVDSYHAGFQELKEFLAESREVAPEAFAEPLYSHYEEQAAEHLFEVAAGIDSMVTGEPQILTQVRAAIRTAKDEEAAGGTLESLFRHAVSAGRRARAETGISASALAFIEHGISLAERSLGSLAERDVLVLGAGQLGELAAQALQAKGVGSLKVLNRSVERAQVLAHKTGASAGELAHLPSALAHADLVVCSTDASGPIVDAAGVEEAMGEREGRPLFFLDLAVPRDVEAAVAAITGVEVANVDDLGRTLAGGDEDEIAKAREIILDEVEKFQLWRRNATLAPLITALQDKGERIREAEIKRARGKLADLTPEQFEAIERVTRGIIAKLLHDPVMHAKEGDVQAQTLRAIFDLPESDDDDEGRSDA